MCGPSSGWSKLALVVLVVGVVIHIPGWATIHWMSYSTTNGEEEVTVGLWRMESCMASNCTESSVSSQFLNDEYHAVRGLETITFILSGFTVILLIIYMCAQPVKRQTMAAVIMVLCFLAGACSCVAMVIMLVNIPDPFEVDYSFGLTVVAMPFILLAGTLMIPDVFEPDEDDEDEDDPYYYRDHRRRSTVLPVTSRNTDVTGISSYGGTQGGRWRGY